MADPAAGMAGFSLFPARSSVLTVEFKINLVAAAKGERLRAIGAVIKPGRTLTICDLKVFAVSGEREVLCATGLQTLMRLDDRADS
jgi:acyl-coenzyme A thioesterase PaaI-like protein